jgi:PadR family transcriptional regulator, regulatory protein AphA
MSLEHILLGLLREPASGYDLKAIIDRGIGHFWAAELSQIYPALKHMENAGWLRSRRARSKRGPGRLVYEVTPKGRRQLADWLRSGPQFGDMRHIFLSWMNWVICGKRCNSSSGCANDGSRAWKR